MITIQKVAVLCVLRLNDDYFADALFQKVLFPESVPRSEIVYGSNDVQTHSAVHSAFDFNERPQSTHSLRTHSLRMRPSQHALSRNVTVSRSRGAITPMADFMALREEDEDSFKMDEMGAVQEAKRSLRVKAKKLFDKYISVGAEYEVNIAWTQREGLRKLFQAGNGKMDSFGFADFIDLFDGVCNEMYKLMRDSYDRFRKKNEYKKLKKLVFDRDHFTVSQ